jgi:glycosyltransferase involved in cell wall biosynthesis
MKIILAIPLSVYSGYGRDGIGMTQALVRAGHDVYLHPEGVQSPLPPDVAMLLTKTLEGKFDLGIVHVAPDQMAPNKSLRMVCTTLIGWTMWEYTNMNNCPGHTKFKKEWEPYDALIAYDYNTADCLRPYFKKSIHVVQGGFEPKGFEYHERDWSANPFFFGMIGVLSPRKNPFAAINAFSRLKQEEPDLMENARLILKTSTPGLHHGIEDSLPGVRVVYDVWNDTQVKDFYRRINVLLAPSRGEGKNLPCLEALSTGAGVIATNWGGHRVWMDESIAYPLDYDFIKVNHYQKNSPMWTEVKVDHLMSLMKHCLLNREEVRDKGRLASKIIPATCNWDARMAELFEKLGLTA